MKYILKNALWLFPVLFLLLAGQATAVETVRINGSGAALDMMRPLLKAFGKANPGIRVEMEKPLGSSGAIKALLAGSLDIAVSSKPVKPEETAKGAVSREYGRMPLVFVTNRGVKKRDITTAELEEIYAGRVRKWPNGEAIRVVLRPDADVDTSILRTLSPRMDGILTDAHRQPGMLVAVTDPESNDMIATTPGAIGASGLCAISSSPGRFNTLSLNDVPATAAALAGGRYPLAKEIKFVTRKELSPAARKLIDFVYSGTGRKLAERTGVVVAPSGKSSP